MLIVNTITNCIYIPINVKKKFHVSNSSHFFLVFIFIYKLGKYVMKKI